jgi:hypothetical protein
MFDPSMGLLVEDGLRHSFDRLEWGIYVNVSLLEGALFESCHKLKLFREWQLHCLLFRDEG